MLANASLRTVGTLALLAGLIGTASLVERARETAYPAVAARESTLYLTSGGAVRRLTTGYHAIAADVYWIRAIQYYGQVKIRLAGIPSRLDTTGRLPADYEDLYPLLDVVTSLDPDFEVAYRFGAIFLAEAYPGGAGRPDLAQSLLEKGLRSRPDKWEYMQDIGFVHYWWRHDYRTAAEWFERASRVPGAPWFLRSLAATTLAEGGDRRSSRTMWEAIRASAQIDWLRRDAERRLTQLDALDFIDQLQQTVSRAAGTVSEFSWEALIRARVIPGVPLDPSRTPYEIDATGRVSLSSDSPLYPLPDEPQRLPGMGS